jgi:hypothetical protein
VTLRRESRAEGAPSGPVIAIRDPHLYGDALDRAAADIFRNSLGTLQQLTSAVLAIM